MPPNSAIPTKGMKAETASKTNGSSKKKKDDETFHECEDSPPTEEKHSRSNCSEQELDDGDEDDEEGAYRRTVYGNLDKHEEVALLADSNKKRAASDRRLLKRLSQRFSIEITRRRTSIAESLPETPTGWVVLVSALSSLCLGYEVNLQKSLTAPPSVFNQLAAGPMKDIYDRLTATPDSILRRNIQPSLFVGTRGVVSSTVAYLHGGPAKEAGYERFREVATMSQDGTKIALDWEIPSSSSSMSDKNAALRGPLQKHVVLILHGINNDANFGYVKALMRACTTRGWAAIGMNFRGCGGIPLATPRAYNGAYTGDIRGVVRILSGRLAVDYKLFIVGNSLGANLITKYLGEEGRGGTLPKCVAGGISLGNPLHIHGKHIVFPWGHLLGLGVRKLVVEHWRTMRQFKSSFYQDRIHKALMASTLGAFDEAMAPIMLANNTFPPYEPLIGFANGEAYWKDASSYRYVRYISVPLLQLSSEDDFLVAPSSTSKLNYSLSNPNVMVVNTRCGGHLGWHECPPDTNSIFGFGTSWADTATADFIDAVLQGKNLKTPSNDVAIAATHARVAAEKEASQMQARL